MSSTVSATLIMRTRFYQLAFILDHLNMKARETKQVWAEWATHIKYSSLESMQLDLA